MKNREQRIIDFYNEQGIYLETKKAGKKRFEKIEKINDWKEIEQKIKEANKKGYDARLRDIYTNFTSPIYKARSKN